MLLVPYVESICVTVSLISCTRSSRLREASDKDRLSATVLSNIVHYIVQCLFSDSILWWTLNYNTKIFTLFDHFCIFNYATLVQTSIYILISDHFFFHLKWINRFIACGSEMLNSFSSLRSFKAMLKWGWSPTETNFHLVPIFWTHKPSSDIFLLFSWSNGTSCFVIHPEKSLVPKISCLTGMELH